MKTRSMVMMIMAVTVAMTVMWRAFSPTMIQGNKGSEFEGAIIALFHLLITRSDKARSLCSNPVHTEKSQRHMTRPNQLSTRVALVFQRGKRWADEDNTTLFSLLRSQM